MRPLARWTAALGGTAALAVSAAPAHASFLQELGSPFPVGAQPYGVVTADFNRDGHPDVLGVNGTTSTVTTILRKPTGGFTIEGSTNVAGGPNYGAVADFNRDGFPDVAVSGYPGSGVSVLLRNPAGGFVNANGSPYAVNRAGAVAAGDFDADGLIDVAASRYDQDGITILRQQVAGNFTAEPGGPATGDQPRFIAVADFNGDSRLDLAVSNIGGDSVTILLRNAANTGFVAEGAPIPVGDIPVTVIARDFTGDDRPDLAVANNGTDNVSVLVRQPGGGFTPMPGSPFAAGDGAQGVIAADFDRDGLLDLATANQNGDNVSVLLRQPGGGFVPETGSPYPAGDGPSQIASADFNGDAKADLAISNDASNNVTVLLNTTPDPPPPPPPPPPPVGGPGPAPVPVPSINARLVLSWDLNGNGVRLTSATVRDLPAGGATVKVVCKQCKVNQTINAKRTSVTLPKLLKTRLKRGSSFSVTVSRSGFHGLAFTRKVKNYGRSKKAKRKAVRAPFVETRKCVPSAPGLKC